MHKTRLFVRFFSVMTLVFFASFASGTANATVLDFNSLATSPDGGIDAGDPLDQIGYRLSKLFGGRFHAFQDGWQSGRGSSNGTTTIGQYSDNAPVSTKVGFRLTRADGGPFDLVSIDLAEIVHPGDFAFAGVSRSVQFTGYLASGGTLNHDFTLDLISDGPGRADDFQTVLFSVAWTGLSAVDVTSENPSSPIYGTYINFDNINVLSAPVPEPETCAMLLAGLGLLGFMARRRKQSAV